MEATLQTPSVTNEAKVTGKIERCHYFYKLTRKQVTNLLEACKITIMYPSTLLKSAASLQIKIWTQIK